jgi:hypothetical protein
VVLTEDTDVLSRQAYDLKKPTAVLQTKLPSFDDEEGNITIYRADTPGKLIIDAVDYDKSYHYPLLKDQSGVSLERINPEGASNDKNNWYSAASNVLATPTYKNSQFLVVKNDFEGVFSLENTRFSPDNDGFEDVLLLRYNATGIGLTATVRVFDLEGRLVKTLINNELLSSEGIVRWDGDTDNITKAAIGNYILLITYFTPDGNTNQEKLVFNLLGKF